MDGEKVEEPRRRFFGNSQVERGGSFKMKPILVVNLLILGYPTVCCIHKKNIFICPESKAIHFIHQSSNNRYTASQEVYKMSHWDFLGCIYSYLDIIYIRIDIAWGISAHTILFHHLLRNKASHFHNLLGLQFTM
jgi:hypothetical protein